MALFFAFHHLLSRMPVITIAGPVVLLLVAAAALHYLRRARQLRGLLAAQQRVSIELSKLSTAVEQSPASIVITDQTGRIEYVNPAFCRLTGYTVAEACGENTRILKGGDQPREFYKEMWDTILAGREWRGEFHNKRKDGTLFWESASISPIRSQDGAITHFVGVKEDVTERRQLLDDLAQMAHYDSLTGLPNRALFFDRLAYIQALSRRQGKRFALLFLDLDDFKQVNDSRGHEAGDRVLKEAAERLIACIRESDTVARMGGDEFTVILSNLSQPNDAALVAEKILTTLSLPFQISDGTICRIGISIGISLYPDDTQNIETLVSAADAAMYAVKREGKNSYRFYRAEATISG